MDGQDVGEHLDKNGWVFTIVYLAGNVQRFVLLGVLEGRMNRDAR